MEDTNSKQLLTFQKIIKMSRRIKKGEVAKVLGLSEDELLARLIAWSDHVAFKIDGDMIVADSAVDAMAELDQQFASWQGSESKKADKLSIPEVAIKQGKPKSTIRQPETSSPTTPSVHRTEKEGVRDKSVSGVATKPVTMHIGDLHNASTPLEKIERVAPATLRVEVPTKPMERLFQDLSSEDQNSVLKKVSRNVLQLLRMQKPDLMKNKVMDLEKYLVMLELEKNRFSIYHPAENALRGFMDEYIALVNQVKGEQLSQFEQQYITRELPQIIKKNEQKIRKLVAQVDRYYTDMDAARDIVEKFIKKSPFPQSYLITVIAQKIRDKTIFIYVG